MIGRCALALAVAMSLPGAIGAAQSATRPATAPAVRWPPPGFVDEALFRDALRARGLVDWLRQYAADSRPADETDAALRRRETILAALEDSRLPSYERQNLVAEAGAILERVIREQPDHPSSLLWRFERARDLLERAEPRAFDAVLRFELPGRDRAVVAQLSARAIDLLGDLRLRIAATWRRAEALDESALADMELTGWLRRLEELDHRSAVLLAWADLYRAVCQDMPAADRRAALSDLLVRVTQRHGWTQGDGQDPVFRCHALILAAIAARGAGRLEEAARDAQQVVAMQPELAAAGRSAQFRDVSLLAVLEQIRVLRDSGRRDEALQAVDAARHWVRTARPEDLAAALAIDLAEWRILAGQDATGAPGPGLLAAPAATGPVELFASKSARHRDALYAALAAPLADEPIPPEPSPLALQWLAGAAVADAIDRLPPERRRADPRLTAVADAMRPAPASGPAAGSSGEQGEWHYLAGQVLTLLGRPLEAAGDLADLVERFPDHDRAAAAAAQAVALAQEALATAPADPRQARSVFVRAGRLLRAGTPDAPAVKGLSFFMAQALEDNGDIREAAREYAAVPPDDPNAALAALRRVRCLRILLDRSLADAAVPPPDRNPLIEETLQAARQGASAAATRPAGPAPGDICLAAEQVLALADVLNHPVVNRSAESLEALESFEERFGGCQRALGQALRQRVIALRRLRRMAEARQVVEQYLATEPERAGPVMVGLLHAMRAELDAAEDRGDAPVVRAVAAEAAELARSLLRWSQDRPERIGAADRLTIAIWQADALRRADRPGDAMEHYEACRRLARELSENHASQDIEIRLGRAEALLATDRAEEALREFAALREVLPEDTPAWWRAFVGQITCHSRLDHDAGGILQVIRQRRYFNPELGGPRYHRAIEAVERAGLARASRPAAAP